MPHWVIVGHFMVEAATPDEAKEWLAHELNQKLTPGEAGSPWRTGVGAAPRYQLASIQQVRGESPVPQDKA